MTDSARVYLRHARESDRREFLSLMRQSQHLHGPWITPPISLQGFAQYLARTRTDDHEGFVVARYADDRIVGVINLNNVVRGSFLSASLGYYVGAPFVGEGYMAEGLELVKRYAFQTMSLHRLEANIQPDNERSIALVKRCDFRFEGLAPAFLYISGEWRDHERWCCVDARESMLPATQENPTQVSARVREPVTMRAVPQPPTQPSTQPATQTSANESNT